MLTFKCQQCNSHNSQIDCRVSAPSSPQFFQEALRKAAWWRGSDWKSNNSHDSSSCGVTSQLLSHYSYSLGNRKTMGVGATEILFGITYIWWHKYTVLLLWFPRCNDSLWHKKNKLRTFHHWKDDVMYLKY